MRVGVLQFAPVIGEVEHNLGQIERALAGVHVDLVVLPELCTTGYQLTSDEVRALAEPFPGGASAARLARLAAREDLLLVAGVAESGAAGKPFNAAVLVGPDGHLATYRKSHLFADELDRFAPGDTGFFVTSARGVRIGMMICFDWMFPESARCLALLGADLLAHPSNLVLPYCQRMMPTRCLENGVFALTANRVGREAHVPGKAALVFTGGSVIVNPRGDILAAAPVAGEVLVRADIDPEAARDKRLTARNHLLADRRPELYRAMLGDRGMVADK
jgi:predicted amidohydrolase